MTATSYADIVGITGTPDGQGYWLVGGAGGVFAFGSAGFFGSTGAIALNRPIVGMTALPDGQGYWLVASDGGVFAFGGAPFTGSLGGTTQRSPILGLAPFGSGGYERDPRRRHRHPVRELNRSGAVPDARSQSTPLRTVCR